MSDAGQTAEQIAATAAAAAAAAVQKPWYDGADSETVGHLKNRGWDTKDAKTVAFEAMKAHREAEKHIGAPANELVRLPKDANDPAWRSVYQRLGMPDDPKGYDFTGVKFSDGAELTPEFVQTMQAASAEAHISKADAPAVARAVVKYMETAEANDSAENAAKLAAQKDTLQKNWGSNFNVNMVVAKNAAAALGLTAEEITALEGTTGYARTMEMFRSVGARIGEDKFVTNNLGGGNGVMTVDQAKARMTELKRDTAWCAKLLAGDTAVKREEDNLSQIIAGAR